MKPTITINIKSLVDKIAINENPELSKKDFEKEFSKMFSKILSNATLDLTTANSNRSISESHRAESEIRPTEKANHSTTMSHTETFNFKVKDLKKYLRKKAKQLPKDTALNLCLIVTEII